MTYPTSGATPTVTTRASLLNNKFGTYGPGGDGMRREQMKREMVLTTGAMFSALGVSRSALRYYEQIGLVTPQRENDSKYRLYTTGDVEHVYECAIIKNAGYSLADASALVVDGELDLDSMARTCLDESRRQREWLEIYSRVVAHVRRVYAPSSILKAELCRVERLLCFPTDPAPVEKASTAGTSVKVDEKAAQALFRLAPVASRGGIVAGDFFGQEPLDPLDCHVAPEDVVARLSDPIPVNAGVTRTIEPCTCARISWKCLGSEHLDLDPDRRARTTLSSFMRARGLRPSTADPAFFADCFPIYGGLYVSAYVPVEPVGIRGRLSLLGVRPRLGVPASNAPRDSRG